MTTITVNERAEAPDWRALAEAEGAGPGVITFGGRATCDLEISAICMMIWRLPATALVPNPRWAWRPRNRDGDLVTADTPALALRAALAWLRETLDREIAERVAARGRLGP